MTIYTRGYTFYSTLVRVESIGPLTVDIVIHSWHTRDIITIAVEDIPIMFYGVLLETPRMWAHVNLGAINKEDLIIKDYQLIDEVEPF